MITRRRRVSHGSRSSELSSQPASRSDNYPCHHHHLHYHYHHHIHHFPRELQDQRTVSSGNTGGMDQQRGTFSNMLTFENEFNRPALPGISAVLRLRQNQGGNGRNFLEELGSNFDNDVDELEELSIGEWLIASHINQNRVYVGSQSLNPGSASLGLSKATIENLPKEVFRPNATGTSEQDECPVCLDHFLSGQQLICLPCNHKFHSQCLQPWLTSHSQCPCCRAKINPKKKSEDQSTVSTDDIFALMEMVDSGMSRLSIR